MDGWMSSLTERQICPKINDKSNFYWLQVRDQSIFGTNLFIHQVYLSQNLQHGRH